MAFHPMLRRFSFFPLFPYIHTPWHNSLSFLITPFAKRRNSGCTSCYPSTFSPMTFTILLSYRYLLRNSTATDYNKKK